MVAIFIDVHRFDEEKLRHKNDNGRQKAAYIPKLDLHLQGFSASAWAAEIVPFL